MVKRAKEYIGAHRPRFTASPEQQEQLTMQFAQACLTGELHGLLALLADEVVLYSDGGGKAGTARNPIYGPDKVSRFILALLQKLPVNSVPRLAQVNGQLAIVNYADGLAYNVVLLDVAAGRIQAVRSVVNPDKLRNVPRLQ